MAALDWNGKLHVVNGSPFAKPYPKDREFWGVTADETVERLMFWPAGSAWAGSDLYGCTEEERAAYAADDILGWTDSYDDAVEALQLLVSDIPSSSEGGE